MNLIDLFQYAALLVSAVYLGLLLYFFIALKGSKTVNRRPGTLPKVSIIIPFRNESAQLPSLLGHYGQWAHEIIMVNDHSTDLSKTAIDSLFANSRLTLLHLPQGLSGKKAALQYGISKASAEWILSSDADTRLIRQSTEGLLSSLKPDISAMVLPLKPCQAGGMLAPFFDLEFMALQAVGLASAKLQKPLMANGAAFLFRKKYFEASLGNRNDAHLASGDDVFTLHAISAHAGKAAIGAHLMDGPMAEASFPTDFKSLWLQRLRWMGKTNQVHSLWYQAVAWLVVLANATQLVAYYELFSGAIASLWMWVVFAKIVGDFLLLAWGVSYFRRLDCLWWIFPGLFIYPFYLFTLLAGTTIHKPGWK